VICYIFHKYALTPLHITLQAITVDPIRNPILNNELVIDNPSENFLILLVSFLPTTTWVLYPVFTSMEYPLYPEYMNAAGVVEIVNGTPFFTATLLISSFQFSGTQNLQTPVRESYEEVLIAGRTERDVLEPLP
jgi:hypothetical protein